MQDQNLLGPFAPQTACSSTFKLLAYLPRSGPTLNRTYTMLKSFLIHNPPTELYWLSKTYPTTTVQHVNNSEYVDWCFDQHPSKHIYVWFHTSNMPPRAPLFPHPIYLWTCRTACNHSDPLRHLGKKTPNLSKRLEHGVCIFESWPLGRWIEQSSLRCWN